MPRFAIQIKTTSCVQSTYPNGNLVTGNTASSTYRHATSMRQIPSQQNKDNSSGAGSPLLEPSVPSPKHASSPPGSFSRAPIITKSFRAPLGNRCISFAKRQFLPPGVTSSPTQQQITSSSPTHEKSPGNNSGGGTIDLLPQLNNELERACALMAHIVQMYYKLREDPHELFQTLSTLSGFVHDAHGFVNPIREQLKMMKKQREEERLQGVEKLEQLNKVIERMKRETADLIDRHRSELEVYELKLLEREEEINHEKMALLTGNNHNNRSPSLSVPNDSCEDSSRYSDDSAAMSGTLVPLMVDAPYTTSSHTNPSLARLLADNQRLLSVNVELREEIQSLHRNKAMLLEDREELSKECDRLRNRVTAMMSPDNAGGEGGPGGNGVNNAAIETVAVCISAWRGNVSTKLAMIQSNIRLGRAFRLWIAFIQTKRLRQNVGDLERLYLAETAALRKKISETLAEHSKAARAYEKEISDRDRQIQKLLLDQGTMVIDNRPIIGTRQPSIEDLHDSIISLYRVTQRTFTQLKKALKLKTFPTTPFTLQGSAPLAVIIFQWIEERLTMLSSYLSRDQERNQLANHITYLAVKERFARKGIERRLERLAVPGLMKVHLTEKFEKHQKRMVTLYELRLCVRSAKDDLLKALNNEPLMQQKVDSLRGQFDRYLENVKEEERVHLTEYVEVTRLMLSEKQQQQQQQHHQSFQHSSKSITPGAGRSLTATPTLGPLVVVNSELLNTLSESLTAVSRNGSPMLVGSIVQANQTISSPISLELHNHPHQRLPTNKQSLRLTTSTMRAQTPELAESHKTMLKERTFASEQFLTCHATGQLLPLRSTKSRPVAIVPNTMRTPLQQLELEAMKKKKEVERYQIVKRKNRPHTGE